jgi:hypothetical protein
MGVLAFSASVFAGPRPEAAVTPDGVVHKSLIGVSRIDNLQPLPPSVRRPNTEAQPTNVPVPMYRVLSDEQMARGGTAFDAAASAVVYRSGADSGYGNFNKSESGNFLGNLLHLGNGFPVDGGEIKGYDLLVYNSVSNPETYPSGLGVVVSLWDGDPLGWIDTRINDPPQQIPQTVCTFTGLTYMGGHGSNGCVGGYCDGGFLDGEACAVDSDCGLCPGNVGHDDIVECPGLYRLVCNFEKKVMIPSRNVWMIVEYTGGCRMGWRWALLAPPEIAAIGEQNFCAGTCPASTQPCVDLAIELVDGLSQWSGLGGVTYGGGVEGDWTCCENGNVCDHGDADTTNDCGHPSTCSDMVATDFSGWCFGATVYWASFVTSIYANTDAYFTLSPEVVLAKPATSILLSLEMAGWGADGVTQLKVWQAKIDAGGYTSGLSGYLTPQREPCAPETEDVDCKYYALGSRCQSDGKCSAGFQDTVNPPANNCLFEISAVDISSPDYRYGSTPVMAPPCIDAGKPMYGGYLALDASADAKGTFTIGFKQPPDSFMVDQNNNAIPLVGFIPGQVTIEVGQCCVPLGGGNFDCVSYQEGPYMTANECADLGGIFTVGAMCDPAVDDNDECGCTEDWQCDDSNACTVDDCDEATGICYNTPTGFDVATQCCHPDTAVITDLVDIAKDGEPNECTADYCDMATVDLPWLGTAVHDGAAMQGMVCEDQFECEYILETCDDAGNCIGNYISSYDCAGEADPDAYCKALDPPETSPASCDLVNDACICIPPSLNFVIQPSAKPNELCFEWGEKLFVDVQFEAVPQIVNGGQFTVVYDPDCVAFNSIEGVDPYTFALYEKHDAGAGMVVFGVGVTPFGGVGASGSAVLATLSFTKLPGCTNCYFDFAGENPMNTYLVDEDGKAIKLVYLKPSLEIHENDKLMIKVPEDMKVNVDCDMVTAMVSWDWPWASSSCYEEGCDDQFEKCYDPTLECWGSHESGYQYPEEVVWKGGEMPQGISTFTCVATSNICQDYIEDSWTVEVSDMTTLDVTIQLSPILVGDLLRCIEFELFEDCVQPPLVWWEDMWFGGLWDHIGHFTDAFKIPKGQYLCITARDQLHTLRSVSMLECVDGVYVAEFKGDPFFGGNWLINGNIDAWQKGLPNVSYDVIDILDFGTFIGEYLAVVDPNTDCTMKHLAAHADINGDGIVDALDFAFIQMNYFAESKDSCCPDSGGVAAAGRDSISVRELRAMGRGDLAVADLNDDGMVDGDDMAAFIAGHVPAAKPTRSGSSLR